MEQQQLLKGLECFGVFPRSTLGTVLPVAWEVPNPAAATPVKGTRHSFSPVCPVVAEVHLASSVFLHWWLGRQYICLELWENVASEVNPLKKSEAKGQMFLQTIRQLRLNSQLTHSLYSARYLYSSKLHSSHKLFKSECYLKNHLGYSVQLTCIIFYKLKEFTL